MRNPTETGRRAAGEVKRKYHLDHVDLDTIVWLIGEMGYDLIDYDTSSETLISLAETLDIMPALQHGTALTFIQGDNRLVFVKDSLGEEEKKYVLAHELGHIACGHRGGSTSYIEEQEANEFVHYFLKPSLGMYFRRYRIVMLVACLLIIVLGSAIIMTRPKYTSYFVTENGKKYHTRECVVIHDRTKLRQLTEEELAGGIYEPCEMCLPPH